MQSWFPLNKPKAVIFDCDGVLFDTESIYLAKKKDFLGRKGLAVSDEQLSRMIGFSFPLALKELFPKMPNTDALAKEYYGQCRYDLIDYTPIYDVNAGEVLSELKSLGLKLACASNADMTRLTRALRENGIFDYFDAVIGVEMVRHGKPDPEVYLKAIELLGVKAEDCLAVEDSAAGIQAAKTAGCSVLAKKHERFVIDQHAADRVIVSLKEIVEVVKGL